MYGLIGKLIAQPGKRDELISILLEGSENMPGCLSYIVAKDAVEAEAIWVTEVWVNAESHQASLSLPTVQAAIGRGRALIAGFGERFETIPVGGKGLIEEGSRNEDDRFDRRDELGVVARVLPDDQRGGEEKTRRFSFGEELDGLG